MSKPFAQLTEQEQALLMDAFHTYGVKGFEILGVFDNWRKPLPPKNRKHKIINSYEFKPDVCYRLI